MPMTEYDGNVEIITNIGTTPDERGLSTDQFKAKFDEGLKAFVTWFNDTHKTEFDAHLAEHSYLQEEEPTNVNPTTLWFAIGSEVNFSGGGVAIQNAETSDTPPETNIWFKPI